MQIDKTRISGKQFMFTVACFLQSSILLTAFIATITVHDSWMTVLAGTILFIPVLWLYRALMVRFPDKNLVQMMETVFGKTAGKLISFFYAWFFLTLASLNVSDLGELLNLTVLPETPKPLLVSGMLLVSAWAVRHGIKVVSRYGAAFVVVQFSIMAITITLVSNLMEVRNFLPMFQLPVMKYIQSTHIIVAIPFGELAVFLMIRPSADMSKGEVTKYLFIGAAMGAVTLLAVTARDVAVQGDAIEMFAIPGLVTLRLIRLGEAFSRMEILFIVGVIMLMFFKVSIIYYVTVMTISQIFELKEYKHIAFAAGLLILVFGPTLYPDLLLHNASAQQDVPFIWSFFEILLPFVTLVTAKLRQLPGNVQAQ